MVTKTVASSNDTSQWVANPSTEGARVIVGDSRVREFANKIPTLASSISPRIDRSRLSSNIKEMDDGTEEHTSVHISVGTNHGFTVRKVVGMRSSDPSKPFIVKNTTEKRYSRDEKLTLQTDAQIPLYQENDSHEPVYFGDNLPDLTTPRYFTPEEAEIHNTSLGRVGNPFESLSMFACNIEREPNRDDNTCRDQIYESSSSNFQDQDRISREMRQAERRDLQARREEATIVDILEHFFNGDRGTAVREAFSSNQVREVVCDILSAVGKIDPP